VQRRRDGADWVVYSKEVYWMGNTIGWSQWEPFIRPPDQRAGGGGGALGEAHGGPGGCETTVICNSVTPLFA